MAMTDYNDSGYEPNLNYQKESYEILKLILKKLSLIEDRLNNEEVPNQELSESNISRNLIHTMKNNENIKNIINGLRQKKILDKSNEVVTSIDKTVIQDFLKEDNEDIKKSQPILVGHSDGTTTIFVKDYNDLRSISDKLQNLLIKEVKIIQ
jgi:hypothetical protein